MKSYIIKIELEESNPLIWRRVIMLAGATYKRLRDVVQNVTNFKSGYPYGTRRIAQAVDSGCAVGENCQVVFLWYFPGHQAPGDRQAQYVQYVRGQAPDGDD